MDNYSVLMSVYYKEKSEYLRQAMDSMWEQTVPTDDFVLVCDGPLNEGLDAVIGEMQDRHSELQVVRLEKNGGLGNALNEGLKHCKNDLVARMDSDDIAFPDRCERQLNIFFSHPEVSICSGTILEFRDDVNNITGRRVLPQNDKEIKSFSHKRNPFNHPAVMLRRSAVNAAGGYNETYHLFEDYYLWIRMLRAGAKGYNIKEPILYMRTSEDLFIRRGGYCYTTDMLRFHRYLQSIGWASPADFLLGAIPHAAVCVFPNNIRRKIYKKLHRGGVNEPFMLPHDCYRLFLWDCEVAV